MLFASFDFLLFFLPVLAAWWALRQRPWARTAVVLAASYFFYMASSRPVDGSLPTPWYFAGLLAFSTVLDYVCSARIDKLAARAEAGADPRDAARKRNLWLTASVVGNLSLLGYFKYTNFFLEAFTDVANGLGASWVAPHLELMLPIGISFYTFQSLSYTIDVWRGKLTPEPSFLKFAFFVVFFPQLVAGPIVRASEFLPQMHVRPRLRLEDVNEGLFRIFKGLVKKVVLGDWLAVAFTDIVFDTPGSYTSWENMLALYGFTLQIYADFSGYSDIAIGVARLLGFKIPENFDRPYQARNLGEFWRRWHMTLSTWLRDYLFFPLGGSKGSAARTYFNLWLTMFLVGMWHGASWNFVIYSNIHGLAMLFNRWNRLRTREQGMWVTLTQLTVLAVIVGFTLTLFGEHVLALEHGLAVRGGALGGVFTWICAAFPVTGGRLNHVGHVVLTFHFTVLSRVFFRAETLESAREMCAQVLRWDGRGVRPGLFKVQWLEDSVVAASTSDTALREVGVWVAEHGMLLLLVVGTCWHFTPREWVDVRLRERMLALPAPVIGVAYALLAVILMNLLTGPRANIYFAF